MTKQEQRIAAMKAAFNVAISEWTLIEKEATATQSLESARAHRRGLQEGLEIALYVIRAEK